MMMKPIITFFASGVPKGQPRPRAFAFNGSARVFDPGTAEGWKGQIAIAWQASRPGDFTPFEGPVHLRLAFAMPRPQSHFRKSGLKAEAPTYFLGKPDADNLAKAVMDALTTLQVWRDDKQVCGLTITKRYGLTPGAQIEIREGE